jgi:serine acetyltransferase
VVGPYTLGDGATVGVNAVVRRNLGAGLSAVPRRNWHYATVTVLPKADNVEEMPALAVPRREAQA